MSLICCVGVPVSSRVSSKIQQLVNTLKKPKRRPLREYFIDDFEELLEGTDTVMVIFGTPQVSQRDIHMGYCSPFCLNLVVYVVLKQLDL